MTIFSAWCCRQSNHCKENRMKPRWLIIAEQELGVHETPGPKATARIVEYDKATTLKATSDEVPWCAAFVCWCLEQAGIESTHSAAAKSFLSWGIDIGDKPVEGCIVVLKFVSGNHHVTFYDGYMDSETIIGLGGNQSDQVKRSNYMVEYVESFRMPEGYDNG